MNKPLEQYGVDIGARRSDDLDRLLLEEVASLKISQEKVTVANGGSGGPRQSVLMSEKGAHVTSVDILDYGEEYEMKRIKFCQSHISEWVKEQEKSGNIYDLSVLQRVIHYLPFQQAQDLLMSLRNITEQKLFISVSGIESAIGDYYEHKNLPIQDRFCKLEPEGQEKFSITEPVFLYSEEEFINLLTDTGWRVEKVWSSAFGNYKAVCVPENQVTDKDISGEQR